MFPLKLCLALNLFLVVASEDYLFTTADVIFKTLLEKNVKRRQFKYLQTIDQHIFANAVDIKVKTDYMVLIEGAVKNLPHLKILRLKDCGIENLPPRTFRNLANIEAVHLQDNSLETIEEGVFNGMPLKELWLHKNDITVIRPGAFDDMPNLEVIRLSGNELTFWDSNWFANTPKLTRLYFHRNFITELPPKAFANIKPSHKVNGSELVDTQIFLGKNKISVLHPEALHGIDSLDELSLKKNRIKNIGNVFSHMTELHKLNLKKNHLRKIDKNAFEHLSEMLVLDLSWNYLTCVPYEVVSTAKIVNVTQNYELDCDCVDNLKKKLREDKSGNKIKVDNKCK